MGKKILFIKRPIENLSMEQINPALSECYFEIPYKRPLYLRRFEFIEGY